MYERMVIYAPPMRHGIDVNAGVQRGLEIMTARGMSKYRRLIIDVNEAIVVGRGNVSMDGSVVLFLFGVVARDLRMRVIR